jgi:hypothetical protein
MHDNTYTEDFADICSCPRERNMLIDIMRAWGNHGLPDEFTDSKVRPAFNRNSGHVFLVNEDYEVCMLRDGRLESWFVCPYGGEEGFFDDLVEMYADLHRDDQEYLRGVAELRGASIPGVEVSDD